jgi:predicted nucleotidyltransferase
MTREEIIAAICTATPALKAEGVAKLAIFGSRARDDARSDSDLDILVEVEPNSHFSALNLVGVQHIIEDATGLPVQATMHRSLEPWMAQRIGDDLIEVF